MAHSKSDCRPTCPLPLIDGQYKLWWPGPHQGKFWKRRLHKAARAYVRGHTRERSVVGLVSTVNYKGW